MVDMWARMCRLVSEGAGEGTAIITTEITAAIAMEGIQEGIAGDIRDGIGK